MKFSFAELFQNAFSTRVNAALGSPPERRNYGGKIILIWKLLSSLSEMFNTSAADKKKTRPICDGM